MLRHAFVWERRIAEKIAQHWSASTWLNAVAVVIAEWTPVTMLAVIVVSVSGLGLTYGGRATTVHHGVLAIVSAVLARALNEPISRKIARRRPFEEVAFPGLSSHEAGNGFPSNHATGAFALAISYAGVAGYFEVLMVMAVLLSAARVYTGLHYITDVCAGVIHGTAAAVLVAWMYSQVVQVFTL